MGSISSTYTFDTNWLVGHFDAALDYGVGAGIATLLGSQLVLVEKAVKELNEYTYNGGSDSQKNQKLQEIIAILKATRLVKNDPTLKKELSHIEDLLISSDNNPPTCKDIIWHQLSKLLAYIGVHKPTPTSDKLINAAKQINALVNFNNRQVWTLSLEPQYTQQNKLVSDLAKYNLKAIIFNVTTICLIVDIALAVLGLTPIGVAFAIDVAFCYLIRQVVDRSMSLTRYDAFTNIPVVIPVPIPMTPAMALPLLDSFHIRVPTWTGVKQIVSRTHSCFLAAYAATKISKKISWKQITAAPSFIFNAATTYHINGNPLPKPNFLTVGGVVILKNGTIPLSTMFKSGYEFLKQLNDQPAS